MSDYLNDDVPRHRKKSNKGSPPKSKHKHEYVDCVFVYPTPDYMKYFREGADKEIYTLGTYCPTCGKIGSIWGNWNVDVKWYKVVKHGWYSETELTDEAKRQLDPKTSTLPWFRIPDCWHKVIPNYDPAQGTQV